MCLYSAIGFSTIYCKLKQCVRACHKGISRLKNSLSVFFFAEPGPRRWRPAEPVAEGVQRLALQVLHGLLVELVHQSVHHAGVADHTTLTVRHWHWLRHGAEIDVVTSPSAATAAARDTHSLAGLLPWSAWVTVSQAGAGVNTHSTTLYSCLKFQQVLLVQYKNEKGFQFQLYSLFLSLSVKPTYVLLIVLWVNNM